VSIRLLPGRFDVAPLVAQIQAHPEVWNTHKQRTEQYGTPHNGVSDIWVRYNAWENYTGDWPAFHGPHESVWYPVCKVLTEVKPLVKKVALHVGARKIGGVLITKVPPGGEVAPHVDGGWHAGYYEKFAVQLQGNKDQGFYFEDSHVSAEPGELYTFDNSRLHWVKNASDEDRMTLIICFKR
jgi:hypothetical protein